MDRLPKGQRLPLALAVIAPNILTLRIRTVLRCYKFCVWILSHFVADSVVKSPFTDFDDDLTVQDNHDEHGTLTSRPAQFQFQYMQDYRSLLDFFCH